MVGEASLIKQQIGLDTSEEVAETFEGIGPQIGQVFKNAKDALEAKCFGRPHVTALLKPLVPMQESLRTIEERELLNQQIDEAAVELIEQIQLKGIKRVEDLNPEELSNLQQGIRSGVISFAMMTPLLVASIFSQKVRQH